MTADRPRRGTRPLAAVLASIALAAGCSSGGAPSVSSVPPPAPSVSAPPSASAGTTVPGPPSLATPPAIPPSRAQAAVDAAAPAAREREGVTLGVAVLDRATSRTAVNAEGDTPLRAASVAKLFTIVDIMVRREAGELRTSAADEQRFRRALGPSDDQAMNALWSTYGGPAGIRRVATMLGLTATRPPADPSQWGQVETSARDVATLYEFVTTRLAPADRDVILRSLEAAPATAADGFDQGFGLLAPDRRGNAAAKQGWSCCVGSSIDLHSTGLLDPDGRYVVVLLSNQPRGYGAARALLDDAAAAARDALAG